MAKYGGNDERFFPPWEFIDKSIKIRCVESNNLIEAKIRAYDPTPEHQLDLAVSIPDLTKSYPASIGNCLLPMYWNESFNGWEGTLVREDTYSQSFAESITTNFKKNILGADDLVDKTYNIKLKDMPDGFIKYINLPVSEIKKIFPACLPYYKALLLEYKILMFDFLNELKKSERPSTDKDQDINLLCLTVTGFSFLEEKYGIGKASNLLEAADLIKYTGNEYDKYIHVQRDYLKNNPIINKTDQDNFIFYSINFLRELLDPYKEKFNWDEAERKSYPFSSLYALFNAYFEILQSNEQKVKYTY